MARGPHWLAFKAARLKSERFVALGETKLAAPDVSRFWRFDPIPGPSPSGAGGRGQFLQSDFFLEAVDFYFGEEAHLAGF